MKITGNAGEPLHVEFETNYDGTTIGPIADPLAYSPDIIASRTWELKITSSAAAQVATEIVEAINAILIRHGMPPVGGDRLGGKR